jgi:hypothetical protein
MVYIIKVTPKTQIMKKLISIVFLFFHFLSEGQNLVRNPSFEEHINCPDALGQIDYCLYWTSFGGTVDYFHGCSTTPGFAPPNTSLGYQSPHSGFAFSHIVGWAAFPDYREILGAELYTPLTIGEKYYFSFYVNNSFLHPTSTVASNKLGIRFSTNQFSEQHPSPINNYSVYSTDSIISDTNSWVKLSGSFIADSTYNFLMIGNFHQNSFTDTIHISNSFPNGATYFIDDVCLSKDSIYNETWTSFNKYSDIKEGFMAYPNPFKNQITFSTSLEQQTSIVLYNSFGQMIKKKDFIGSISINTETLENGLYFYELLLQNGEIRNGKLVKNQ